MNSKTAKTRERILEQAYHLFYQHGFHAICVDRIAKEAAVTRQTLYNHFPSKDDILLEVITRRDHRWREGFRREIQSRGGPDPVAQLRSVFDVLGDWFHDQSFNGCLFISAASEFPATTDPAHQAAKANVDAIRGTIAEVAATAGFPNPQEFAAKFSILIQGAIINEVIDRDHRSAIVASQIATALINEAAKAVDAKVAK